MNLPVDVSPEPGCPFIGLAQEVVAEILKIVEDGWRRTLASSSVRPEGDEVEMNEQLRDGMRRAVNERPEILMKIVVGPGTESRSGRDSLRPDGRTDIPLFLFEIFLKYSDHNPHAVIECKRVAGCRSDLCHQYVVEGIDRFRGGKYSANHSAGFMVGYVLAGDADSAAAGINRYLKGKLRAAECLHRSDLVVASWAWRSVHVRSGDSPIDIHHALLGFLPPQRLP